MSLNNESAVEHGFIQTIKHERCVGHGALQSSDFLNWTQRRLIWALSATAEAWLNIEPLQHCCDTLGKSETRGSSNADLERLQIPVLRENHNVRAKSCVADLLSVNTESTATGTDQGQDS